jgi:hypothetical protein
MISTRTTLERYLKELQLQLFGDTAANGGFDNKKKEKKEKYR